MLCVAVVTPAAAQGPPRSLPPAAPPAAPRALPVAPPASPPAAAGEAPLRDVTPPEFADLIPPPDPHAHGHTPGCLTPSAPQHAGFYGTAEYLLFRVHNGSLDYAQLNPTSGLAIAGPVQNATFDLGSGVRTELGYHFEKGWDLGFGYTYFNTQGNQSVTAGAGQVILPTLTRPGLTDTALTATANTSLNYNVYDMIVGKRLVLDEHFTFRAIGGLRFAEINQRFNTLYNGLDAVNATVTSSSRFSGFGPIIGGEAVLNVCGGFHGYARTTGGLLTGRSRNAVLETNDGGATTYVNTQYNVRKVVPLASIAVGGGWQYRTVSIRAGYEVTQWFGLTEPVRYTDDVGSQLDTRPSNLSLEGFFVQFGLTF
ncbi:Lpg1974 family pore-forming outer membrane protein [Gemmata sp.]|uniref:Lpg1974 family pore-forming outer membrane protein n=1 Tax=Gemmata sp. TaxID=1914242 RepID=UPI003F71A500